MATKKKAQQQKPEDIKKPKCGIIMPISAIDGCTSEHWQEVLTILKSVTDDAGFDANLVSYADESGIIQKNIIQNLYNNEIVICDVSCKNPNVMFELGIRLAFDKPTIIIKDELTDYSFDTSIIEHLKYPRDLHFHKINAFKEDLKNKLQATYTKASDPNYTTFLKHFGEYKVAGLVEKEISSERFVLESLTEIRTELANLRRTPIPVHDRSIDMDLSQFYFSISNKESGKVLDISGTSKKSKALIQLWDDFRKDNQIWVIRHMGGKYCSINSLHSGKCIEVKNSGLGIETPIQQNDFLNTDNQLWEIIKNDDYTYRIIAKHSKLCIEADKQEVWRNGGRVIQYSYNGFDHQKWILNPIPVPTRASL